MEQLTYNTALVLAGTGVLGIAAGVVGCFAVLRRRALVGDALSHAALPGLCLAFLVWGERNFWAFLVGALVTGTLSVAVISWIRRVTRVKEDAAIGIVLSVFFGVGIVLSRMIQGDPRGSQSGLDSYLFGQTAGMIAQDALAIGGTACLVVGTVVALFKEFHVMSFDGEFAAIQGWPVARLDFIMMALIAVTTVIGLPAVGVVLMAALLILPAVTARFWTRRLGPMLALSGVVGALMGLVGTLVSAQARALPAGPVIVLVGTGCLLVSLVIAPGRGWLARLIQRRRVRSKWLEGTPS